ncbi:PREDICTED: DNA polymerase lambda-like isoform X2 [Priapulus caudatus]|uniref:DNA polymerase n=1 Tax=Priapulus caudatus TaxID=37621 RepID=A0ABM1EAH7_PRICU|nr:PREDICTED: DNA polymerase lambda-like isoform X2 [Priapulus caudatus]
MKRSSTIEINPVIAKQQKTHVSRGDCCPATVQGNRFFTGVTACIVEAGIGKARVEIFRRQLEKYGGTVSQQVTAGNCTHIIVDENMDAARLCRLLKIDKLPIAHARVLKSLWLSACLKNKHLVDTSVYELTMPHPSQTTAFRDDQIVLANNSVNRIAGSTSNDTSICDTVNITTDEENGKTGVTSRDNHKSECSDNCTAAPSSEGTAVIAQQLPKGRWVCAMSSKHGSVNHNPHITDKLEEAAALPSIGQQIADKIWEIVQSGCLRRLDEVMSGDKMAAINLFNDVWGAGPGTAERWVQQGFRTLDDVRAHPDQITKQQAIGLNHFEDFLDRMPRSEAAEIENMVQTSALAIAKGLIVQACGSYRRGKPTCGDTDVLITHPDGSSHVGVLHQLVLDLHQSGFITDDLVTATDGTHRKYLGACKLPGENRKHRRIDIIVVPYTEYACALLYFTGSAHFNRSMRLLAIKKGMTLSEHRLNAGVIRKGKEKLSKGQPLSTPTEESVFEHLGLPYRPPEERDHYDLKVKYSNVVPADDEAKTQYSQ